MFTFSAAVRCTGNEIFVVKGDEESIHGFTVCTRAKSVIEQEMGGMSSHATDAIYGVTQVPFKESGTCCTGERAVHQTPPPERSEVEGRIRAAFANAAFAVNPDITPGEGFQIHV